MFSLGSLELFLKLICFKLTIYNITSYLIIILNNR